MTSRRFRLILVAGVVLVAIAGGVALWRPGGGGGSAPAADASAPPAGPAESQPSVAVTTLPDATLARLGVRTAPAEAARFAPGATGFARVVDPSPLAVLLADLEAARAAASASEAEARRTRALAAEDQMIAAKTAEAAAAQAAADRSRLALARARLGLEWGPWLAAMTDGDRRALVQALARGETALVRIDGAAAGLSASTIELDLGTGVPARARILGAARTTDPRLQTSGWLAIVHGPAASRLAVGLVLPARLPTGSDIDGVRLPSGAVLRAEGRSWAYVRAPSGGFERRVLTGVTPMDGDVFASGGVGAGETLVIQGASALYTSERAGG